ncbi:MAG: class I SAM-dependent methyltransferase [Betaproteobacteria bacterium]|nr:class I SAM-dependent methyltransferase [Betaproteobacteria bacterium]
MKRSHSIRWFALALCLSFVTGCAQREKDTSDYTDTLDYTPSPGQDGKDVVWVPTPQALVDAMLDMAKVTPSDYIIDLGSGDGRLVITAAKRGATALGIEYNPELVELANHTARKEKVRAKATFKQADIFESDFSQATVITLFLLPDLNLKLRPIILDMKPGTRIVSNSFDMGEWKPDQTKVLENSALQDTSLWYTAYLWIVPAKVDGIWRLDNGQISFVQDFQNVTGTLTLRGKEMDLTGKLDGNKISFHAGGTEYVGTVSDNKISGKHAGGGSWKATR